MDIGIAKWLAQIDAAVYIIDCRYIAGIVQPLCAYPLYLLIVVCVSVVFTDSCVCIRCIY
jgi:hypothetical protein